MQASFILDTLVSSGNKITATRKAVASWIIEKGKVFSAKEILKDLHLDKVTLYRTLELFKKLDIIHPVLTLHGEEHYELHGEEHSHHVVCKSCEKTVQVGCDIPTKSIKGFTNIHHSYVLTGMCAECSS